MKNKIASIILTLLYPIFQIIRFIAAYFIPKDIIKEGKHYYI